MRLRILTLLLLPLLLTACSNDGSEPADKSRSTAADSSDSSAVRAVFERYRSALRTSDIPTAIAQVDGLTIVHYGRMKELALVGEEVAIRALPLLEQVLVLSLRHRVPLDTLRTLPPEGVLAWTFRPEWTGDIARQQDMVLGRIEVDGDEATGEAAVAGETTGTMFYFKKEGESWKVDLSRISKTNSERVETMFGKDTTERAKFLAALLKEATGRADSPELWKPPVPAGK